MSVRTTIARAASALLLAACAGGEHRGDSATARAPQPTIEGEAGATAAGATTAADSSGATAAAAPRDSTARPTPLPMPEPPARPPADAPVTPASSARRLRDTLRLRGVVAVVGAEPMTEVVLRGDAGRSVRLVGAAQEELRRLSGVEVWVRGRLVPGPTPRPSLEVARYAVLSVGGVPARDGVIAAASGQWYLVTLDGTWHRLPPGAPAALRAQLGARVWVSGRDTNQIASFGVIRPRG